MSTMNIFDMTDTWNASGTTFAGIALNVTDTASASGSLLMDLQVGGASKFRVSKTNGITVFGATANDTFRINPGGIECRTNALGTLFQLGEYFVAGGCAVQVGALGTFSWQSTNRVDSGTPDTFLRRDAANTLAQRNGVNAQAFRLYGSYTDGSNSRRLVMTMSAAGVAEIKPDGLGSGASGNVLHISGLPTSNPGAGILWNNGGTVEVGT